MGLFGSRKKTYVSSTCYNLAGDVHKRTNFFKNTVITAVLVPEEKRTLGTAINNAYTGGPGIRMRGFARWARNRGYANFLRMSQGGLYTPQTVDLEVLEEAISTELSQPISLLMVEQGDADYLYWVEQYLMRYRPELLYTDWIADLDDVRKMVTLQLEDSTTLQVAIPTFAANYEYIYATYYDAERKEHLWIYRKGSGKPALDAAFSLVTPVQQFYPIIPIRIHNKFLDEQNLPDLFKHGKKAYKKAFGGDMVELQDKMKEGNSIKDIDHAFVVFGVSLNTPENVGRKYIYKFFQWMMENGQGSSLAASTLSQEVQQAQQKQLALRQWEMAQADPVDPLNGTAAPSVSAYPMIPVTKIRLYCQRPDVDYDMTISWTSLTETTGTGLLSPGRKVGEVWWEQPTPIDLGSLRLRTRTLKNLIQGRCELCWQESSNRWRKLSFSGLLHTNLVYGGKKVEIQSHEALDDPDESGFIIPLHETVFNRMSIKDYTQLTSSSAYLVLNSYQVVKKKWYQTGLFKVIVFIVAIIITVVAPYLSTGVWTATGVGAGVATAVLGTIAVGTLVHALIAAVVNAIVAAILVRIFTHVGTELFGEEFGAIIGAIAAVVTMQVGRGMAAGQSFGESFAGLMSPANLMNLTMAAGDGWAGYLQESALAFQTKTQDLLGQFAEASGEIADKMAQLLGTDGMTNFDPMELLKATLSSYTETRSSFLSRTLLTGSDIAEISMSMLGKFTESTLSTDLP